MRDSEISATPLLLLPGLICDARIWAPQAEALRARGFQARAVAGYGEADSLTAMAETVLADAPERFALAGHSMGGRVVLEVYRRAPERVERLALISTGVHPVRPGEADGRFRLLALGVEQGMEALVDAWLTPMVWAPNRAKPGLMDYLTNMCLDMGLDCYERQVRAMLDRPEVESLLSTITCPTLVATGDHDEWASPEQHEAIAAAIPGATLNIVKGAGHMLQMERPKSVTDILASWMNLP
jgi:pimeloyl-ACP methyl ester carboxylesterase